MNDFSGISGQVDDRLEHLDKAVSRRDREQIIAQAPGLCSIEKVHNYVLTEAQRWRMRAIAYEIDKLGDDPELKAAADELRRVSKVGLP